MFVRKRRRGGDTEKTARLRSASEDCKCRRTSVRKGRGAPGLVVKRVVKAQSHTDGVRASAWVHPAVDCDSHRTEFHPSEDRRTTGMKA